MLNNKLLHYNNQKYSPSDLVKDVERLMLFRMCESKTKWQRKPLQNKPNYKWLCNKDNCIKITVEQSVLIKRLASKLTPEDCSSVLIQLEDVLIRNENINSHQIPQIAKELLSEKEKLSLLKSVVPLKMSFFRRINSFRVRPESIGESKLRQFVKPSYLIFTISRND